jgi:hypothetical protein
MAEPEGTYGDDEHAAATKIQAQFRGHQSRRRADQMHEVLTGDGEKAWGGDTNAVADFLASIEMEEYTQTFYDNG